MEKPSNIVSLEEAAALTGKSPSTIKNWINKAGSVFVIERGAAGKAWKLDLGKMLDWRIEQAAKVPEQDAALPPVPDAYKAAVESCDTPIERVAIMVAMALAYQAGASAAIMAVHSGAPLKVAYAIKNAVDVSMTQSVADVCRYLGPFRSTDDPNIWRLDAFLQVNWEQMAEIAGEPVDLPAWQEWAKERATSH